MTQCTSQDWNVASGTPGTLFKSLGKAAFHSRVWTQADKNIGAADPRSRVSRENPESRVLSLECTLSLKT